MAGQGGARPGAGAKKGQHRVHVKELRDAIEAAMGEPFQDIQAKVFKKLFNDFQNDTNVKEFVVFNENMGKRILEQPVQEVSVSNPLEELSSEDIKQRIDNLLTRAALAQPTISNTEPDDGEETQSD
jgi:uncharacterized protein YaaW (UPF0174 family)